MLRGRMLPTLGPLAALAIAACGPLATPTAPTSPPEVRVPLILVPGVTGTSLRAVEDGAVRFGRGRDFLAPRDRGYNLVEPLAGDPRRRVEAGAALRRVRLGPFVKAVYEPLADLATSLGYREGDPEAPGAGDSFFLFAYDWRRDNVESAAELVALLERIRASRGADRLEVDLLCQSNGAHICRWAARYSDADLAGWELSRPPRSVAIRKLILLGTSNGGALRILREMNRGRRYVPGVGRYFSPEIFFTMASLYQDLPFDRDGSFLDADGKPLAVDLYDPESWVRYGWSIFGDEARRRADRRPDLFGDDAARLRVVTRLLSNARLFHQALDSDGPAPPGARYHLLENVGEDTPLRAVLEDSTGAWRTHFVGDRWLRRQPALGALTTGPGDGHASLTSQRRLSPRELAAMAEPPRTIHGPHFETILAAETHAQIAAVLRR